jgi:hypothetical protein
LRFQEHLVRRILRRFSRAQKVAAQRRNAACVSIVESTEIPIVDFLMLAGPIQGLTSVD